MFSIKLVQAISDWQRGGDKKQKAKRGKALKEASQHIPERFRKNDSNCYRQIALDKKLVWNIGTQYQLSETISSWTTSLDIAKTFKGGVPPADYQGVIFKITSSDNTEVIINLQKLFDCSEFQEYVENNKDKIRGYESGIGRYGNSQAEVVLEIEYLPLERLFSWGGYSNSETELAALFFGHEADDKELEIFRDLMEQAGNKCGAYWVTNSDAVKRVSEKLKIHGERLSKIKEQQENMNKKFDRTGAILMDLSEHSENPNDKIQYLIPLKGSLFVFATNYISKILTADCIDPQNLYPETRHSSQKLYSIGCANSLVARSIIQAKQILDPIILKPKIYKQEILDHSWSCTEILLNCEDVYYKIYKETLDLIPKCDAIIEEGKKNNVISTLPQVENLEANVAIFLGNAKRFLEKTHEFLCMFYNAPNSSSNFQAYREWFQTNKSDKKDLIKLLEEDKNWIKKLAFMRNAHEMNHAEQDFNLEIANFRVCSGNQFSSPGWRYDFSGRQGDIQEDFSDIVADMNICITNLLTFFEELLMQCIIDNSDKNYNFEIYKKNPENINANCPSIYYVKQ